LLRSAAGIGFAAFLSALVACESTSPAPRLTLTPAAYQNLPGWADDRHGEALMALQRSCARILAQSDGTALGPQGMAGRVADWRAGCAAALAADPQDHAGARALIERHFAPFAAADNDAPLGLFTGYYEPELRGALARDERYAIPLYGRPADLVTVDLGLFRPEWRGQRVAGWVDGGSLRPYPSRAEIEAGALANRARAVVWVDDPVDAFFLHIQGSGRVVLDDGRLIRVGYAAQNGHPYVAIGRELIARGAMAREDVSMQSIRAWLRANPSEMAAVMNANPSYVFFRALDGDGPLGSEGVVLTPGRSLAVDRGFIAFGVPIWLDVQDPLNPATPLRRLVVAQDTGGAIRGPVRGDVFWGHGTEAAERAGRMRSQGRYWLLLPTEAAMRIAATN
jgi:membrane-bound lytic murein transglycosylase A